MCSRWDSYQNFLEDMGERPAGTSLDRISNDEDYSPSNCRWATRKEQNRNNSQNRMIELGGVSRCLAEWCELLGLDYAKTYARLYRLNWSPEDALK